MRNRVGNEAYGCLPMLGLAVIVVIAVSLSACKKDTITVSEACEIAWKIFYQRDGRFAFTDDEIDHLRPVNVDKLSDFKTWFKGECPTQYARTIGGKKK